MTTYPLHHFSRVIIALTVKLILIVMVDAHAQPAPTHAPSHIIKYTTITGYFLQDDPSTNASTFDYKASNFGLINRTYESDELDFDHYEQNVGTETKKTQWQRFQNQVHYLNSQCDNDNEDIRYKLLYLGRHGEGYHNVAESFYGTPAWDCYWSKLDGNDTVTWADAHLTATGIQQAEQAQAFWYQQITTEKIPVPESYYTSPLSRCLATANITFSALPLPSRYQFIPTVKELLRETIGIHTCDRRSPKSTIHSQYPRYIFEPNFTAIDTLWSPTERETDAALDIRLKSLLDDIFFTTAPTITTHDDHHHHNNNKNNKNNFTFLSLTSHGGAIGAILRVIGHIPFRLSTGGVIPVLVKAERIYYDNDDGHGITSSSSIVSATPGPTCTVNPTASRGVV